MKRLSAWPTLLLLISVAAPAAFARSTLRAAAATPASAWQEPPSTSPRDQAPADSQETKRTYDLTLSREPGGPFLIDIESTQKGSSELIVGTTATREATSTSSSRRFIDEVTACEPERKSNRTILKWEVDADGAVADPDVVGLTFDGTVKGDQYEVKVRGDRFASRKSLERIRPFALADALFVPLIDGCAIGGALSTDAQLLLRQLLDLDGTVTESTATLKLESVDAATGVAVLRGSFALKEELNDEGDEGDERDEVAGKATVEYSGTLMIEVDLTARRVVRAKAAATAAGAGTIELPDPVDGQSHAFAKFDAELSATARVAVGAPVEAARKAKVILRSRLFECPAGGVSLELPSSFHLNERWPETLIALPGRGGNLVVGFRRFDARGEDPAAVVQEIVTGLATRHSAEPPPRDVMSALGKGRSVRITDEEKPIDIEVYPLGREHVLMLRIMGPAELRTRNEKSLTAMRGSLKALEQ